MASYSDSPSCSENSTSRKCILKQRKCSEEFILTLEGENDSLEVFLPGRTLGTISGRYSNTMDMLPMKKQKLDRRKLQDFKESVYFFIPL